MWMCLHLDVCMHMFFSVSVLQRKCLKVQEFIVAKCACFFLSFTEMLPFYTNALLYIASRSFGLFLCHIYDHSDYCKLNLNVECCNNMHVNLPVLILEF